MKRFKRAGNQDVIFADVNLRAIKDMIRGDPYNIGQGGWPTILYFNKDVVVTTAENGIGVGRYKKKTNLPVSIELGPKHGYLLEYIETVGRTMLCNVFSNIGCTNQEIKFITKYKLKTKTQQEKELSRLIPLVIDIDNNDDDNNPNVKPNMKTPEFQSWVQKRIKILQKLIEKGLSSEDVKDEL